MYFLFMFFYVLFVCKYVLLPPGVNPIAVKYIIHIYIYIYIYTYIYIYIYIYVHMEVLPSIKALEIMNG